MGTSLCSRNRLTLHRLGRLPGIRTSIGITEETGQGFIGSVLATVRISGYEKGRKSSIKTLDFYWRT